MGSLMQWLYLERMKVYYPIKILDTTFQTHLHTNGPIINAPDKLSVTCDRLVVFSRYSGFPTNKTDCHVITEILWKVALNTTTHPISWLPKAGMQFLQWLHCQLFSHCDVHLYVLTQMCVNHLIDTGVSNSIFI
jgi:hypothetical protein